MTEMDESGITNILHISKPVLMLDVASFAEQHVLGRYTAKHDYFYWDCHFTNNPVMPGTYMLEMLGQTAALLEMTITNVKNTPLLVSFSKVRFLREVKPNAFLISDVKITNISGDFYTTQGKILVDEKTVCKAEMTHVTKI